MVKVLLLLFPVLCELMYPCPVTDAVTCKDPSGLHLSNVYTPENLVGIRCALIPCSAWCWCTFTQVSMQCAQAKQFRTHSNFIKNKLSYKTCSVCCLNVC